MFIWDAILTAALGVIYVTITTVWTSGGTSVRATSYWKRGTQGRATLGEKQLLPLRRKSAKNLPIDARGVVTGKEKPKQKRGNSHGDLYFRQFLGRDSGF